MTDFPIVKGYCPACGNESLYLGEHGAVTCGEETCPDPAALDLLLYKADPHVHLIMFSTDGYTVQHPLLERVAHGRMCELEPEFVLLREAPGVGLYLVPAGGGLADMVAVTEREVTFEVPPPTPVKPARAPVGTITEWREPVAPDGWVVLNDDENRAVPSDCTELLDMIESGAVEWQSRLADGRPALPSVGPDTGLAGATKYNTLGDAQEVDKNYRLIMRIR